MTSTYYLDSYMFEARLMGMYYPLRARIRALMEMQEWSVIEIIGPEVIDTPDCPPEPGMVTVRVSAVVSEFDTEIPMSNNRTNRDADKYDLEVRVSRDEDGELQSNLVRVFNPTLNARVIPVETDETKITEHWRSQQQPPMHAPLEREQWERLDGGGLFYDCDKCKQVCEIPEPPKEGERVLCDECRPTLLSGDGRVYWPLPHKDHWDALGYRICERCRKVCELAESPKPGQHVLCDLCSRPDELAT